MEWLIQLSITYSEQFSSALEGLFQWAVTSSILILIVLAARRLLRNKLSARLRYALWAVVLLRLLVPFQVELPAPVTDSLPLVASNLTPELGQWEKPSIPLLPQERKPVAEFDHYIENTLEPGEIRPYQNGTGGQQRSIDGETITWYRYILSPEQIALALWLAGAGLTGAVILLSNLHFARLLRKRRTRLEGVTAPIPVYVAEGLPSPCLFGIFRPAVYLTPAAAENPNALRHVLAHELTHRAHLDHIWSLLRCLALVLHWYNPLVWLAAVLSKGDGELACDEGAVARLGEGERIPYGRTLVDMVAARSLRPADLLSCSTAMTGGKKSIQQRIALLVKKPETARAALFAAIAVVALSAVFVFAGRTQPRPGEPNPTFLSQLEQAAGVGYSPQSSLYSSTSVYSTFITDEDLLSQAKEALSSFTFLADGEPYPDLEDGIFQFSGIMLSFDGRTEERYSLLWQDHSSYLLPGNLWEEHLRFADENGPGTHLQSVSGTMRSGENVMAILDSLARQQYERTLPGYTPLTPFLQELEAARSIYVGQPALSSANPPGPITDADALSQAKYLLRQGQPPMELPEGVTWEELRKSLSYTKYQDMDQPPGISQEELEHLLFMKGIPITLSKQPEPASGGETSYYLAPWENMTLLLQWDAEVETAPVKVLADYDASLISEMTRLPHLEGPAALLGDLTVEQLRETWTPLLGTPGGPFELGCFFTSSYEDPTQINLKNFLEYCPLAEEVSEQTDQEEYRKVIQASAWAEELANNPDFRMPVPVHRYPREKVSDLLKKHADVAVEELDWKDVLYLEEYDAFYNFTSDQASGSFYCAGGQIRDGGNSILLWSRPTGHTLFYGIETARAELRLQKINDRYYIRSHYTPSIRWAD